MIFISPYLKGGQKKERLLRRTKYIAKREGVELLQSQRGSAPASEKQRQFILRLLSSFPQMMELGEYEDYAASKTMDAAAELIDRAWEQFVTAADQRENFLDYVAHRPGVKKEGEHGLWDRNGKVPNLQKAVEEISCHKGIVWTPVVSLRREDAQRLGYTNAENWRAMINACTKELADGYKISPKNLRWYAALHEKEKHIHIHMIVFSSDPKEGYLTKEGIRHVKSALATHIFEQDLLQIYERKTEYRNTLQSTAEEKMAALIRALETTEKADAQIGELVWELARRLRQTTGRKVYGYLPPQTKRIVDEIVDTLAQNKQVASAYALWQEMRDEVCRTYSEQLPDRTPLSQQKEFKTVRNMVIRETLKLLDLTSPAQERKEPDYGRPAHEILPDKQEQGAQIPQKANGLAQGAVQSRSEREQSGSLRPADVERTVIQMLYHMGRIFRDNTTADAIHRGVQIDRKRRRALQEKRMAMGHKADDHEGQQTS